MTDEQKVVEKKDVGDAVDKRSSRPSTPEDRVQTLAKALRTEVEKGVSASVDKLEAIQKQIDTELNAWRVEFEKMRSAWSVPGSGDAKHNGEGFSFAKAFHAVATGKWEGAPLEKEIMLQATEKAANTYTDAAGGYVVPIEVLSEQIIPKLDATSVVVQAGATTLRGLRSVPTMIPRISGGTTAYWIGEGTTGITESQMAFEMLKMTPKILAALSAYTDLLGNVSSPGIEQMVRNDIATRLALKLDLAALEGGGGTEPVGIENAPNVQTNSLSSLSFDKLVNHVQKIRGANALMGNPGWVISNAALTALWQVKDPNDNTQPTERRVLSDGPIDRILGFPYYVTTQKSAATDMIFGNWNDLIVGQWGGMVVATTNAVGFTTLTNHIRTHMYVDLGIRHPESFVIHA